METFQHYFLFVRGIHRSPVYSPINYACPEMYVYILTFIEEHFQLISICSNAISREPVNGGAPGINCIIRHHPYCLDIDKYPSTK